MTNVPYQSINEVFSSTFFFFLFFFQNTETNYFGLQTNHIFFNLYVTFNLEMSHRVSKIYLMFLFYRKERYVVADQNWMQLLFLRQDNIYVSTYLTDSNCLHYAYNTNCRRKIFRGYYHFGRYNPKKLTEIRRFKACLITGLAAIPVMYSLTDWNEMKIRDFKQVDG